MTTKQTLITAETVSHRILFIRGQKVILGNDLAVLYGVEHKVLMQAVKRNLERFPEDFMFQVSEAEWDNLKSQFVTSSWGGVRKQPYAFTEQGIAMLSGVLRSQQAVQVNIEIMRAFIRMRLVLSEHKELAMRLAALEKNYDAKFKAVFDAIRQLTMPSEGKSRPIGFTADLVGDKK